jgi:deoxyribonucleoside regulator
LPAIVDSEDVKKAILKDKNISSVLNLGKKVNIAIITIGAFGEQNALAKAGYLSNVQVDELFSRGAVGDIFSRIINIHGEVCDPELDRKTIAIELADFKKIENRIVVAAGRERAKCLCGALRGGFCNILITEETTAREVLRLNETEE